MPGYSSRSALTLALALLVLLVGSTGLHAQSPRVDRFIKVFDHGTLEEQMLACRELEWSGISDTRLYDVVEKKLLALKDDAFSRDEVQHVSWLVKALGYSGQERYRDTISQVAETTRDSTIRRHAGNALGILDDHERWNPIMNDRSHYQPEKSVEINRYAAMLLSGDAELQRLAAKRIHYEQLYDDWLMAQLDKALAPRIAAFTLGDIEQDASSWMLRALAGAGLPEYRSTLERAAKLAGDFDLQDDAASYLDKYYND